MENSTDNIEQPFWDMVTTKVDKQEHKVLVLEQKIVALSEIFQILSDVRNEVAVVKSMLDQKSFPERDIRSLNTKLDLCSGLLSRPTLNKVEHHHYIPKLIYITAVVTLGLLLAIVGLFITYGKLDLYEENDTKYRFLKLQNNASLQQVLFITDSLFHIQPDMRNNVKWQEDSVLNRFKRLQEIKVKEKEVRNLKGKLK